MIWPVNYDDYFLIKSSPIHYKAAVLLNVNFNCIISYVSIYVDVPNICLDF